LERIQPDIVHVFVNGSITESGGPELANEIEKNGYERFSNG
jgi:Fe-S cluster assembly ATP-binding protein